MMGINKEEVKAALDDFENDNFVDAKEKLKNIIKNRVTHYVADKTGVNLETGKDDEKTGDVGDEEE